MNSPDKNPQCFHSTRPTEAEPQSRIQGKDQEGREGGICEKSFNRVCERASGAQFCWASGKLQSRPQGWPTEEPGYLSASFCLSVVKGCWGWHSSLPHTGQWALSLETVLMMRSWGTYGRG